MATDATLDDVMDKDGTCGWNINVLEYRHAMAGKCPPSTILVGLSSGDIYLGVQKDHVNMVSLECGARGEKRCCEIIGGKRGQVFPVVRVKDPLVVIKVKKAVMFAGDFPHAGVRNFSCNAPEQILIDELDEQMSAINRMHKTETKRNSEKAKMLTNFKGLSSLCRFHYTTVPADGSVLIPQNRIGYTGCLTNLPDGGFTDKD